MPEMNPNGSETPTGRTPSFGMLLSAIVTLQLTASFAYPLAKYGLEIIEPLTFAFYRFGLASAILLVLARSRNHTVPVARRDWPRIVLLGILIIPLNQTLFLVGQSMTAAGHGAFLFATTPIWIFILALIHLKETFLWRRAVGIAMALVGVTTIMSAGALNVGMEYLLGDVIIVISVIAWAYYTVLGKPLVLKYGALRMTAYALACGSAIYFPFGLYHAVRFDYSQTTPAAWATVAYMAIGLSLVVYVLWFWVLKYMDASRIAVYHNMQPVVATTVAILWLGEQAGLAFIVGGAVILAGLVVTET